jgi:alkanesulfonate monooxygenase SsuD/methylene tetrahydromethanopterin reductase-like flavin-dependent oxidoreductase (luciferase family)
VALSVAAAETQRVRLGPLVSPITFRQPAILARMAEALDSLSHGRFVIGLGLGWNADEHAQFGIPFPPLGERTRQLISTIQALGDVHSPLLIGGSGPRSTLPIVARYADEWNLTTASVDVYLERSTQLGEMCAEVGRDPTSIRRSVAVGFLIGRTRDELRSRSQRMKGLVPPLANVETDAVAAAAQGMGWVTGTPMQIIAALMPLAKAGVDLAILGHYDLDDMAALESIAADVMPALA